MTVVFIFKSGKVSKITVTGESDILQKIKNFFSSEGHNDSGYLMIEEDGKHFFVNLDDVSAVEIVKQNKRVK